MSRILVMSRMRFRVNPHSSLAKWLSVRLRSKWLWVRVPMQSLNSYEVERSGLFEAININVLYDYHPLSIYKNKNRFILPLKHFISDQE